MQVRPFCAVLVPIRDSVLAVGLIRCSLLFSVQDLAESRLREAALKCRHCYLAPTY
jgi:hypothetical protein